MYVCVCVCVCVLYIYIYIYNLMLADIAKYTLNVNTRLDHLIWIKRSF